MLTSNEITEVNCALEEITENNIDLSHFKDIFVIRRENDVDKFVKDIGDFLHHSPKNKGPSYDLVKEFCEQTVKLSQSGHNELKSNWLFIGQEDFVKKLINSLINQNCFKNQIVNMLESHAFEVIKAIIMLLDGRDFEIKSDYISSCKLSMVENGETIALEARIGLKKYSKTNSMKVVNGNMVWTFSGPICTSFLIAHKPGQRGPGYWRVDDSEHI